MSEFKRPENDEELDTLIQLILFYKNPYDVLFCDPSMPVETIKSHYRKLAAWIHPDRCHHDKTTDAMTALKKAMDTLETPESRQPFIEVYQEALEQTKKKWEAEGKIVPQPGETNEEFNYAVKRATHTLILTVEDRMRKASAIARSNMEYQEELRNERREEYKRIEEQQKQWDEGREQRINDWKNFAAKKRKPGSLKKPTLKKPTLKKPKVNKLSKEKK